MVKKLEQESKTLDDIEQITATVIKALEGLRYGEVVIKVQGGKVIWVDRYERERLR